MWKSISPQQEICPSSLASRACLSQRRRPSTFSLAPSTQDAPPNKWLIWHGDPHGDRSSEVCLCGLSSLMRSTSLPTLHPVSPVLRGRAQKKKATRRSVHTHDANGYQATSSLKRSLLFVSIYCIKDRLKGQYRKALCVV